MQPIFLHGMWRSGSTWLWSRFRDTDATLCFYEPLHHGLAKLTRDRIARCGESVAQANRHPLLGQSYWQEYAPLIQRRGVADFHRSLAEHRYCLRRGESHPRLSTYIETLLEQARRQGRTPVLGFNRTAGRVAWLKDRFDSYDILIRRTAPAVWASYRAEAEAGNHTYFAMWLRVVSANRLDPIWRPLAQRLGFNDLVPHRLRRTRWAEARIVRSLSAEDSYFLTAYAWRLCELHAAASVDLVIDDSLATDDGLRQALEKKVRVQTGVAVSLSGFNPSQPRLSLDPGMRTAVEQELAAVFPDQAVRRLALEPRSPGGTWAQGRIRTSGALGGWS